MAYMPCFLCGAKLERRIDKNRKSYFVCNPCGIQLFIRRQRGIELLEKLMRNCEKHEIPFRQQAQQIYKIQALLTEIDGTKKQIDRLKAQTGLFFPNKDKIRACNLLKLKMENLFTELKQLAKQNAQ
jgi:hypothetical protein